MQAKADLLRSSKMSGRRKLRRDHSSARLFCNGVPVKRSRFPASYDFRALGGGGEREGGGGGRGRGVLPLIYANCMAL